MPVTPFLTVPSTPRTRMNYTSDECRQNALKIRQENDWFCHSDNRNNSRAAVHSGTRYSNEQHRISRPSSATWWSDADDRSRLSRHGTPESRKIQEKMEAHDQHAWYKHGPGVPDPPSLDKKRQKSRRSACSEARARLVGGDSNGWFKHEQNSSVSPAVTPSSETPKGNLSTIRRNKDLAGSITWLLNDIPTTTPSSSPPKRDPCPFQLNDGSTACEASQRTRSRIISPDADSYQRRNNEGSASQWFVPKSTDAATPQSRHPRKRPTKFSVRLDAESEDWYSFRDASKSLTNLNSNRGLSPSPSVDVSPKLSLFNANSNAELDLEAGLSTVNLNGATAPKNSKWNGESSSSSSFQKQPGNGFKHFIRLDEYFEPTWSVNQADQNIPGL